MLFVVEKDDKYLLLWEDYRDYISHLLRQATCMCPKNNSFALVRHT